MTRVVFLLLLIVTGCVPAFTPTDTDLWLTREGNSYTLNASGPIEEAAVTVRAEAVESALCEPVTCAKDAEGRVHLYAPVDLTRGSGLEMGQIEGLVRLRAAVVLRGEDEALVRVIER